jgi:micrococcal nuclease
MEHPLRQTRFQWYARKTMIRCALALLITVTATALSASAEFIPLLATKQPLVAYVIDGDTIAVRIDRTVEKVRLIGIDTPESRKNERAALQAERSNRDIKTIMEFGRRAKDCLKSLLPKGTELRIEYDVQKRDKYGRLLGYVYRTDNTMINEEMLLRGYAQLLTIPPNVKYVDRFKKVLAKSQKEKRGLWASGGFQN